MILSQTLIFSHFYIKQHFSTDTKIFFEIENEARLFHSAGNQKLTKNLLPWAAQIAQTEELVFQNMACRPTVYKTGLPRCKAGAAQWPSFFTI